MSEAPKKIWLNPQEECWGVKQWTPFDTPYIRADLVDGLVEALQHISNSTMARTSIKQYALAALKALEEP